MIKEKEQAKQSPLIILDVDFQKAVKKRVLKYMRELFYDNKIEFGRTMNNNFVALRNLDEPRRNRKVILHESQLLKDD